jgi:hypothetical protein
LSFAPQKRFTAGNKCGPMNSDAKRRVQVQELDGAGLDESKRHSLSLGSEGRAVAADPWPEIDVYFVDDTTADAGLNNYVHTLKKHWFGSTNVHSHLKQDETRRRLTAIEAACLIDDAS